MRGAVYVNGRIMPAREAVVPVYDHGFVYGEGVYETLRTYNTVPFLYDRHVRRLRQSAGHIDLVVEAALKDVDICPLIPLIHNAGGVITTWDGGRAEQGGNCVAAATPELHAAAMKVLRG